MKFDSRLFGNIKEKKKSRLYLVTVFFFFKLIFENIKKKNSYIFEIKNMFG